MCFRPAVRPLRCLRLGYVIHVDSPACPAMPLPPTMPLRHSAQEKWPNAVPLRIAGTRAIKWAQGAWPPQALNPRFRLAEKGFYPAAVKPCLGQIELSTAAID